MRAFLALISIFLFTTGFSQNFVSPGIIAYHSGAYERTIKDMNKAFESSSSMETDVRAKAHYYRGMARLKLLNDASNSNELGDNPYLLAYNDLNRAMQLDSKWRSSAQSEINGIYQALFSGAKKLYDRGIYASTEQEISTLLGPAVLQLDAAIKIKNNFEVNDLLGKVYDAMGIFYDQLIDDQVAKDKALTSYQSAMKYYEVSVDLNPESIENIRALKQLAYRLGDRNKEIKYAQMEASIGG